MITLSQLATSTEYIQLQVVTTQLDGTTYNPTSDPVYVAFLPITSPASSPDPSSGEYNTAFWTTDTSGNYWAGILVGPLNGGINLAAGSYQVCLKVTDSPAVPVKQAAYLVIS